MKKVAFVGVFTNKRRQLIIQLFMLASLQVKTPAKAKLQNLQPI